MKKTSLVLALSLLFPMVSVAVSHAAANGSDLAVGDPMGGGYHRAAKKHTAKKPAEGTEGAAAKEAPKPAAEKPAEPAK